MVVVKRGYCLPEGIDHRLNCALGDVGKDTLASRSTWQKVADHLAEFPKTRCAMFQIGFETGEAFRVSAFGEGGDQPSNDSVEIRLRLAVSQLTPGTLLFVAVAFEQCGAAFRLCPLSRQPAYRFRPADVCSADPRCYRNEQRERSPNVRESRSPRSAHDPAHSAIAERLLRWSLIAGASSNSLGLYAFSA